MKTVNGKLLGQLQDEREILKQQLDLRCQQIENMLTKQREYRLSADREEIEQFHNLCQELGDRLENLENSKFDKIESNLDQIKQQFPLKLLWLTFSSSIAVGLISVFTWIDINSNISPQIENSGLKTEQIR